MSVSLLAAYDMGASAAHLRKIYHHEAPTQRPIFVEERDEAIVVTDDNWAQYLGNQRYVK
jgi:Questin oxidase-like